MRSTGLGAKTQSCEVGSCRVVSSLLTVCAPLLVDSLPPPRLPGYVLANLLLVFRIPHQFTEHPENFLLPILLLSGRGRSLPKRFHPTQAPLPCLALLALGFAHAALPSSDRRIKHQHNRTQLLMHHALLVSHVWS